MDLDEIYVEIGEFGPLQIFYFFSIALFNIYPPFNMIQVVFTGELPSFTCTALNGTTLINQCPGNKINNCDVIEFDPLPDTFAKEWKLVCDETYKVKIVQSLYMGGVLAGALIFGPIADAFGRRDTLMLTMVGTISFGAASSFIPTYFFYALTRFLTGMFGAGSMISSFVLATEIVGPSKRNLCGNIIQGFFALGIVGYSVLGYFVRSWRLLAILSTSVGSFLLFTLLWIPESPRWLFTHKRSEEAIEILSNIAARNGRPFPEAHINAVNSTIRTNSGALKHVFANRAVCFITLIQLFSWFVNSVVYYGLTLAVDKLGWDIYVDTALLGIVEIPAYILTVILLDWSGRRKTLTGFMIVGGVACLLVKFSSSIFLPILGKLAIAASFSIIYIQSAELFPTVLRNSGLGLCSCFARIGGIVAPYIALTDVFGPSAPFILMGGLSVISGVLNCFLPETKNKPMPETIHDLEALISGGYCHLVENDSGN